MKVRAKFLSALVVLDGGLLAVSVVACGKRGGVEKAGEKVDEAVDGD